MRAKRLIGLLILISVVLSLFASCTLGAGGAEDGGGRTGEGWETVDFNGQTVKVCISVNQYVECSFPAADIYTKGPDEADSNEVTKEVLMRNAKAAEELNLTVEYMERDLEYDKVLEDIQSIVLSSYSNSPDVYNNDLYGLSRAMVNNLLWNVKNPGADKNGNPYVNYFDFEADGWYTDFIKGCTFDQSKYYLFAGDYFIDMIRLAWVIYVNNDKLAENIGKLPSYLDSVDSFYSYVADGDWDYDMLSMIASRSYVGSTSGKTQKNDPLIGFAINNVTAWAFGPSTGTTVYYMDENDTPQVMESIDTYQKIANKYVDLVGQNSDKQGVFFELDPIDTTRTFIAGNVLFAASRLGEMESPELRNAEFGRGVVPIPKWDADYQDAYHTVVHDQTEIGCILKSAKAYSAASALMQYLNEESDAFIYAYYEKGMKYKYNDDPHSRAMMDIIREGTVSPFGPLIAPLCEQLYTGPGYLTGLRLLENTTVSSTFGSEKYAYRSCLDKMIAKFASFE